MSEQLRKVVHRVYIPDDEVPPVIEWRVQVRENDGRVQVDARQAPAGKWRPIIVGPSPNPDPDEAFRFHDVAADHLAELGLPAAFWGRLVSAGQAGERRSIMPMPRTDTR